uniref:Uncharacterized protein n=1 Tax=Romanomermis culicivorax TaxID=13658 RepID=A0A915IPX4_ROMCU
MHMRIRQQEIDLGPKTSKKRTLLCLNEMCSNQNRYHHIIQQPEQDSRLRCSAAFSDARAQTWSKKRKTLSVVKQIWIHTPRKSSWAYLDDEQELMNRDTIVTSELSHLGAKVDTRRCPTIFQNEIPSCFQIMKQTELKLDKNYCNVSNMQHKCSRGPPSKKLWPLKLPVNKFFRPSSASKICFKVEKSCKSSIFCIIVWLFGLASITEIFLGVSTAGIDERCTLVQSRRSKPQSFSALRAGNHNYL